MTLKRKYHSPDLWEISMEMETLLLQMSNDGEDLVEDSTDPWQI